MNLPPFKLERYFAKYEFNAEFLLCSSDCEAMSIADLLAFEEGAAEKLQNIWLGYTESQGSPALRKEICNLYTTIQPENILVHTGAGEAIYLFMHAILKENDHVIVHAPSYQSLSEVAKGIGCRVSPWLAREENGWALDLDELRHLMRTTTKAV
ncbi:MAG: aminotransferase class I/II-fold pyridoxal phosphate-dependent enzyme, partial [Anaerolineales bacterium]|nr:aminotransferase class I/II-fold pyridoxal phosphate-dependent enzyme [Anaerolineales bacterium]